MKQTRHITGPMTHRPLDARATGWATAAVQTTQRSRADATTTAIATATTTATIATAAVTAVPDAESAHALRMRIGHTDVNTVMNHLIFPPGHHRNFSSNSVAAVSEYRGRQQLANELRRVWPSLTTQLARDQAVATTMTTIQRELAHWREQDSAASAAATAAAVAADLAAFAAIPSASSLVGLEGIDQALAVLFPPLSAPFSSNAEVARDEFQSRIMFSERLRALWPSLLTQKARDEAMTDTARWLAEERTKLRRREQAELADSSALPSPQAVTPVSVAVTSAAAADSTAVADINMHAAASACGVNAIDALICRCARPLSSRDIAAARRIHHGGYISTVSVV